MIRPSVVIKHHNGEPYLRRWHLIPRNRFCNVYLHHFVGSDDERATHDHRWWSLSFKLKGSLWEFYGPINRAPGAMTSCRFIPWLWPVVRSPEFSHRLVVPFGGSAWTLFLTGPAVREWGFNCADGWKDHRAYDRDGGCDDA